VADDTGAGGLVGVPPVGFDGLLLPVVEGDVDALWEDWPLHPVASARQPTRQTRGRARARGSIGVLTVPGGADPA
jgi:hypothetical protein